MSKTKISIIVLAFLSVFQTGCALFALPGQILGIMGTIIAEGLRLAQSLPKPPPGIFF